MFVLVALWTLLVAPSTCGGGLLAHACADDEGPSCGHESDCPSDPCNVAHDVTTVAKTLIKAHATPTIPVVPGLPAAPAVGPVGTALAPDIGPLLLPSAALPLLC